MEVFVSQGEVRAIFLHGDNVARMRYERGPNVALNRVRYRPFAGATENGVGIGSTRGDVLQAFGEPDNSALDQYVYFDPQITFSFDGGNQVRLIGIVNRD